MEKRSRTALITGCSSGIGRELTTALLARGYTVLATLRNVEQRRRQFHDELERFPGRLELLELDVTQERDRQAAVEHVRTKHGGSLDLLVNNAGFGVAGAVEELSSEQVRWQFDVNVIGLIETTQALLPYLREAQGRIINVSSVLGYSGLPYYSLYCASKHAIEGFSESLSYELAPFGVQVAVVEPGAHETRFGDNVMWGDRPVPGNPYGNCSKHFREAIHAKMKNRLQPSANVVLAICDLAEAKRMRLRTRVGKDAALAYIVRRLLPQRIITPLMSRFFRRLIPSR